eukprot:TRINITY_DN9908_c0_g1_i2.p1 TRINITY_DN9908_c0_g1~~TRINITY_DN9908_c0_g1_i2.p1  ORF type:complete len:299 (-),score=83.37 TRINITY_DN9908_c0_g1_i2:464-1360(-)
MGVEVPQANGAHADEAFANPVETKIRYLVPQSHQLVEYTYPPENGDPQTNGKYELKTVKIGDLKALAASEGLSVDKQGFTILENRTQVRDWDNVEEIQKLYYPEAIALVKAATGASRVVIFDHTIRKQPKEKIPDGEEGNVNRDKVGKREPVRKAHVDYTVASGPQKIHQIMGTEAEKLLKGRFAEVNVWQPLRGPVQDTPLAVADARSIAKEDLVPTKIAFPGRWGEVYSLTHNPAHRWYFIPEQRAEEALLFKSYDSVEDGSVARFTGHSAFDLPNVPADALPRQSIETRTLVFWE